MRSLLPLSLAGTINLVFTSPAHLTINLAAAIHVFIAIERPFGADRAVCPGRLAAYIAFFYMRQRRTLGCAATVLKVAFAFEKAGRANIVGIATLSAANFTETGAKENSASRTGTVVMLAFLERPVGTDLSLVFCGRHLSQREVQRDNDDRRTIYYRSDHLTYIAHQS
jgi:hypothetical protein